MIGLSNINTDIILQFRLIISKYYDLYNNIVKKYTEDNSTSLEEYTDKGYTVVNVFIQETLGKKILEKQEKREKERLKKIRHLKGLTSKPSSSKTSSPLSLENLVKDVSKSKSRSKNVATNTQKSFA